MDIINTTSTGLSRLTIDPGMEERLVIRFPHAEIILKKSPGNSIECELDLGRSLSESEKWHPEVRRTEGILVIADSLEPKVRQAIIGIPDCFDDIEVHTESGGIEARGIAKNFFLWSGSGSMHISGAKSVEAHGTAASILIEGSESVDAKIDEGRLCCRNIAGAVRVKSVAADVSAESVEGKVNVICGSGEVVVIDPKNHVDIQNISGDIELDVTGAFGGGTVDTKTGDISVICRSVLMEVRAETLSGKMRASGVPIQNSAGLKRCVINKSIGGKRLRIRSLSGAITIENIPG